MEKLKELWKKLNLKVAVIGGVVVVSTSLGTCHLTGTEEVTPETEETTPVEKPEEDPAPEVEEKEAE